MFKRKSSTSAEFGTVNIKATILNIDEELLNKHFGCARFVRNWAVDLNKKYYKDSKGTYNYVALQNMLPELKEKNTFLKEVDSTILQQSLQDYWQSMQMFFKRKGGLPHFKTKKDEQSCRIINTGNRIRIDGNTIKLAKFDMVKIKPHQSIPEGNIASVTVKRTKSGKLYLVITIRRAQPIPQLPKTNKAVGIDVGVAEFAHFSDNAVISKPDYINKYEAQKRRAQRKLSRMERGSANYEKQRIILAKICEKEQNCRRDFQHKLSIDIVRNYDIICCEHLNIKQMLQGNNYHNLHRMIQQSSWHSFLSMLEYKSKWYGKTFVQVDTYFPSSQLCSECGYKNSDVKNLNTRKWTCPECGVVHQRDNNAAVNILHEGLKTLTVA